MKQRYDLILVFNGESFTTALLSKFTFCNKVYAILQVRVYIFIMEIIPYLRIATAITLKEARVNAGIYQYQLADFSGLSCSYIAAVKA